MAGGWPPSPRRGARRGSPSSSSSSSWGGHNRGDHYDRSSRKASSAAGSLMTAMSGSVRICRPSMSMGSSPARRASSAENRSAESKDPRGEGCTSPLLPWGPLSRAASSAPGPDTKEGNGSTAQGFDPLPSPFQAHMCQPRLQPELAWRESSGFHFQ